MRYDFTNALFHFFSVFSRRPLSLAWVAFWQFLILVSLVAGLVILLFPIFRELTIAGLNDVEPDPEILLQLAGASLLAVSLAPLVYTLALISIQAAWLRLLARDEVKSIIPLRLGGDELRLLVINLFFIILWVAAFTVIALAFIALNAGFAMSGLDGAAQVIAVALGNTVLVAALTVIGIVLMLRFAAAPALTILNRRIDLFGGFDASKGILAWMFLTYLVAVFIVFAIAMVLGVAQQIVVLFAAVEFVDVFEKLENIDDPAIVIASLGELLSSSQFAVLIVVLTFIQLLAQIIYEGLWHGIGAYIARRHTGLEGDTTDIVTAPSDAVGAAPEQG